MHTNSTKLIIYFCINSADCVIKNYDIALKYKATLMLISFFDTKCVRIMPESFLILKHATSCTRKKDTTWRRKKLRCKVLNVKNRIKNKHELKKTIAFKNVDWLSIVISLFLKIFIHIWCGSSSGSGFSIDWLID